MSLIRLIPAPGNVDGAHSTVRFTQMSEKELRSVRNRIATIFRTPDFAKPCAHGWTANYRGAGIAFNMSRSARQRAIELLELAASRRVERIDNTLISSGRYAPTMTSVVAIHNYHCRRADHRFGCDQRRSLTQGRLKKELGMAIIWITHDLGGCWWQSVS